MHPELTIRFTWKVVRAYQGLYHTAEQLGLL